MKVASVLLLLLVSASCVRLSSEAKNLAEFARFQAKYSKSYKTQEEWNNRYQIFQQTLERIAVQNARSKNATYGVTQFADMTPQEFKSQVLMSNPIIPNPADKERVGVLPNRMVGAAPAALDWRAKGAVTPVKNQEQCGSCWAFSATENIESVWIIAGKGTNATVNCAPQQIVDCDTTDAGCDGGNPPTAYEYVISAGGLDTEASYPYTAQDGTCNFQANTVQAKISNWQYATTDYSESTLQTNLVGWGPLSVCVDAEYWQNYVNGVMDWEECAWVNELDHCVQLVGYDTTASTPYWIVRNSWGTSWGINGYIWLAMGGDTCGITHEASSAVV